MIDWALSLQAGPLVSPLAAVVHPSPPSLHFLQLCQHLSSCSLSITSLAPPPPFFFLSSPCDCCQLPLPFLFSSAHVPEPLSQEAHTSPNSWQGNEAMLNPATPWSHGRRWRSALAPRLAPAYFTSVSAALHVYRSQIFRSNLIDEHITFSFFQFLGL